MIKFDIMYHKWIRNDFYMLFYRRIVEIPIQNKSIKQSVNKDCIQNNFESNELCTQELSPVLGNRQRYIYCF